MFTRLDPQDVLRRRISLVIFAAAFLSAAISTIVHSFIPPIYWIDRIAPPIVFIVFLGLFILVYKRPQSLPQAENIAVLTSIFCFILPAWIATLTASLTADAQLIETLPPITSVLFLLVMLVGILLRPRRLLAVVIFAWIAIAAPILLYLLLHPSELQTRRGMDLAFSLGPAMAVQLALVLLYARLQRLVDRLYTEQLQYYEQTIERQAIRQQAMEQAFTQIHNGPLQTLALLMREVQSQSVPATQLLPRLTQLNQEIRAVGQSLTDKAGLGQSIPEEAIQNLVNAEQSLRLGEGTCLDLALPLHNLLYEVYTLTLRRPLPHFQSIRVKVRDFAPLPSGAALTFELKRDLCLWLEEMLCNAGKYAQGCTRLVVTGQVQQNTYVLTVKDNGPGLATSHSDKRGTQQSNALAQRLGGQFRRESLPKGGTLCELVWPMES